MGIVESLHQVVFHWLTDDLNRRFGERFVSRDGARANGRS